MTASQLIPVVPGTIGNVQCLTVDGRTLHGVLGVRRDFSNWIKGRISKYGFIESQDFEVFAKTGENSEGGRPSQEYTCTLDMGKELCMVENNEKGRIARRYFIECERRLLSAEPVENPDKLPSPDSPLTPDQQCTLQAIVRAKIEALPREQRGGLYPKTWSRFNNHFRLARYAQLPQSRMSEAVAYLTQMDVAEGKQALPSAPTVSTLETVEAHLATIRAHAREIMDCERRMYFALRDTLPPLRGVTRPLTLRLHENMDSGFGLLDAALRQVENTARLVLEYGRG